MNDVEPIIWNSCGQLLLDVKGKQYWYFGVKKSDYEKIKGMCRKAPIGKIMQYMKKFSRRDMFEKGKQTTTKDSGT